MTGLLSVPVAIPAPPYFDSVREWLSQCCRVLILQSTAKGFPCSRCVVTFDPSGRVFSGKFHHPFPKYDLAQVVDPRSTNASRHYRAL